MPNEDHACLGGTGEHRSSDRRGRCASFRYPERRTGFDRRGIRNGLGRLAEWSLRCLRDHEVLLAALLVTVNALNVADLVLTLRLLSGGALEGNPVMSALLGSDPLMAAVFKLIAIAVVSLMIWRMRRYRNVIATGLAAFTCFSLIVGYEGMLLAAIR